MIKKRWLWPTITLLSATAACFAILEIKTPNAIPKLIVLLWFLLICPGMGFVRLIKIGDVLLEWILAIALSLSIDAAIAGVFLYAGKWSPGSIFITLLIISVMGTLANFFGLPQHMMDIPNIQANSSTTLTESLQAVISHPTVSLPAFTARMNSNQHANIELPTTNHAVAELPTISHAAAKLPVISQPIAELPTISHVAAKLPVTRQPIAELPTISHVAAKLPVTRQPIAELPTISHAVTQLSATKQPIAEIPSAAKPPVTRQPIAEIPSAAKPPVTKQPIAELPTINHVAAKPPVTRQPIADIPTISHSGTELSAASQTIDELPTTNHSVVEKVTKEIVEKAAEVKISKPATSERSLPRRSTELPISNDISGNNHTSGNNNREAKEKNPSVIEPAADLVKQEEFTIASLTGHPTTTEKAKDTAKDQLQGEEKSQPESIAKSNESRRLRHVRYKRF